MNDPNHPTASGALRAALAVLSLALGVLLPSATVTAQEQGTERAEVTRLQQEILRKAERLRSLMTSMLSRYQKQGDEEKVQLLQQGLAHLEQSAILDDVARVREDLDSDAIDAALRKQREVVQELEGLIAILLERPTVETLDEEIRRTEARIAGVDELSRRQRELRAQTEQARDGQASAAEQQLSEQMGELSQELRREADENQRQAGMRRPVLENALREVERLLNDQSSLERSVAADPTGESGERELEFRTGAINQDQRDAQATVDRARDLQRVANQARELAATAQRGDDERARQLGERVEAGLRRLATATEEGREGERRELEQLAREVAENPAPPAGSDAERAGAEREAAARAATQAAERLEAMSAAAAQRAADQQAELADRARELANQMRSADAETPAEGTETGESGEGETGEGPERGEGEPADPETGSRPERGADEQSSTSSRSRNEAAARAAERASRAMERAAEAAREGDLDAAQTQAAQAAREADAARENFERANPDADQRAGRMAEAANRTARALRNSSPEANQQAEGRAAESLEATEQALRQAAEAMQQSQAEGANAERNAAVERDLDASREALERARDELRGALDEENAPRDADLEAAQARPPPPPPG